MLDVRVGFGFGLLGGSVWWVSGTGRVLCRGARMVGCGIGGFVICGQGPQLSNILEMLQTTSS